MKKHLILLIALFYGFIGFGQVAYGDAVGTLLTIDTNFQLSAAGLYFERPFGGGTKSVIFSIDTAVGFKLSAASDLTIEAVGLDLDTNATSSKFFYFGESDGGALFMAEKFDLFGTIGANMIAINAGLDTLVGFRACQYHAQWVYKMGTDTVIQTLPNHYGANGYSLVTDGAGNTDWQPISGTLSDTAIKIAPSDFTGNDYTNPILVNSIADTKFLLFADEGSGTLCYEPDGYTFNSVTGTISTPFIGRYRLLILR